VRQMEINYLREFVILTQTGNFMEAAEQLYSSQSTLSKHIKKLEVEFGVPLFNRTTRKVEISSYGQLLLPYAMQIIEFQDQCVAAMQRSLKAEQETLTVGSIRAMAQYKIIDVLVNFKKSRPQSIINVIQTGSTDLKAMVRQKKCEVAFIRDINEPDDDLVKIPYAIDTLVAVLPTNHPLANQELIPLEMLANDDFLLLEEASYQYKLCISACEQSGFKPRVAFTNERIENLIEMVSEEMGVALLMKPLALYLANSNIAIVDITPRVTSHISLCFLKDVKLSKAAEHFLQCAKAQKKSNDDAEY
jgi:LysR family transcriptional activator of glutamate synthase operon